MSNPAGAAGSSIGIARISPILKRIVELVWNESVEPIARAIHARWLDEQIGAARLRRRGRN